MTIDRTKAKPNYFVEINELDISDFIVGSGFFTPSTKEKIKSGRVVLDSAISITLKRYNPISFYVQFDNKYKRFGGVISNVKYVQDDFIYIIEAKSFEWLAYETTYTGIFRDDAGKGNRRTIIEEILTEKFPGCTWDETSFPLISSDYDIIYKQYDNRKPAEIFDELLLSLNRDWWMDENYVFYAQERDYTQVNQPIEVGTETIGLPVIEINNRYANIVKVWGYKFSKYIKKEYSGTGAVDEFELDFVPDGSSDVEYSDGTQISVTMEGNEDYDDSAEYDAYFKTSDKKIKFNAATTIGSDNIIVKTRVYDQIRDEQFSATEIERVGREVVKEIRNENIQTPEEATQIAKNYINNYAKDLDIFRTQFNITTDDQLKDWKMGNSLPVDMKDGKGSNYTDLVEVNYSWSTSNGFLITSRFVDSPRTDSDVIQELINQIRLKDQAIDNATTNITRFFYFGANIVFGIQNISVELQDTDGSFELQEVDQDDRSWMTDGGTTPGGSAPAIMNEDYSTATKISLSSNTNNKFIESFLDEWFIDDSTASLDENLALLLKCNDDLATTNVIESISGNDGTSNNNTDTMSVTGFIDHALSFNGNTDYLLMPNDKLDFINNEDFSISFRLKTTFDMTGLGTKDIMVWYGSGKWILIRYGIFVNNNVTVQYYDGTTTRYCRLTSSINDGQWHTIQCTFDRDGDMEIYLDKILEHTTDISGAIIGTGMTANFQIMYSALSATKMEGSIDDIRIYRELLSSTKRQLIIDNPRFIGEKSGQTYILDDGEELVSKEIFTEEGKIVSGSSITSPTINGTNVGTLNAYAKIDSSGFHLIGGSTLDALNGTFINYKLRNVSGSQSIITAVKIGYVPQVI